MRAEQAKEPEDSTRGGWRLGQLRSRLILLVLLAVIPAFILALYTGFEQRQLATRQARSEMTRFAHLVAAHEESLFDNTRQLLGAIAVIPYVTITNAAIWNSHFQNLLGLQPSYFNFGLIEANGDVFSSAVPVPGPTNVLSRAFVRGTLAARRFTVGECEQGPFTNAPTLHFGYPVVNASGEVVRVLFGGISVNGINRLARKAELPPNATLTILDRAGNILVRSADQEKWEGKSEAGHPLVRKILAGVEGVVEMPGLEGEADLHAFAPVRNGGEPSLFVNIEFNRKAAYADANRALLRNLALLAFIALGALSAAHFYGQRYVLAPVEALRDAASRVSRGDLSARAEIHHGAGEINQLGKTFNDMAESLQKRQNEITQLNHDLEARVRSRTSELERANRELESFSYSVSHDLRAPLRHIDGFSGLLESSLPNLDAASKRHLDRIKDAARRMGRLIDDLLVFSRMGREPLRKTSVDLRSLVKGIIDDCGPELEKRAIEWKIGELARVEADASMLRQALFNLVSNAIKYTRPRDRAVIEIGATGEQRDIFYVRDNGVGFDMNHAAKLFGVFQRLHSDREFEGTGIGLANVQRIIQRHGGRIWAEARLNEGAAFYFTLSSDAGTGSAFPGNESGRATSP